MLNIHITRLHTLNFISPIIQTLLNIYDNSLDAIGNYCIPQTKDSATKDVVFTFIRYFLFG